MTDAVATIRIETGKANAITPAFLEALDARLDAFERGPARAAVVTGYDRFFSAGLALPVLVELDRPTMKAHIEQFSRVMLRLFACAKPVVAAINGHAIAGGCVLALMCDWRVSADDDTIRIGLNETQLGIGLPAAVLEPLRAQVPASSLVPIALEGALSSPRRAHELGLVHELAPARDLEARTLAKAQTLAEIPALAAAQVKRGLRAPVLAQIERSAAVETERWLDTWFSPEGQTRLRTAVAKITR